MGGIYPTLRCITGRKYEHSTTLKWGHILWGGGGVGGVATFRCTAGRKFEHSTTPEVGVYKNCFVVVVVCIVRTTWVFGDVPKTQTQLALPLWLVLGVQRRGALN